jgi:hypothetical protein
VTIERQLLTTLLARRLVASVVSRIADTNPVRHAQNRDGSVRPVLLHFYPAVTERWLNQEADRALRDLLPERQAPERDIDPDDNVLDHLIENGELDDPNMVDHVVYGPLED